MLNRFYNDRRITFIGSSNNLNKQGFTSSDMVSGMGGFGGGNAGNGINTSSSAGINYTDVIGKIDVQGSYMYGKTNKRSAKPAHEKQYFLQMLQGIRGTSLPLPMTKEYLWTKTRIKILICEPINMDSMNSLLYTPSLSLQNSNDNYNDSNNTKILLGGMEYPGLSGISKNENQRKGVS